MFFRAVCPVLLVVLLSSVQPTTAGEKTDPIVAYAKEHLKDAAKPFTLVVILQVKEDAAEKFEAAFAKARVATRKEKGCITYDLNRDSEDAKRYVVYERWKSLDDLEKHLKTDHIKALRQVLPDVTAGAPKLHILLPASE